MFYEKNSLKSHLILREWHDFEKGQNWPFCKGYSKPKRPETVSSEFQLISAKSMQEHLDNNNIVNIFYPRNGSKSTVYQKMTPFRKGKKMANHFAKAVVRQHCQTWPTLGLNFKERKSCKNEYHKRDFLRAKWLPKAFKKWQN